MNPRDNDDSVLSKQFCGLYISVYCKLSTNFVVFTIRQVSLIDVVCFDASRTNFGRIRFLECMVAFLFFVLAITIFYRQYLEFHNYNKLGEQQCLRRILYPGLRGNIYDRNGQILATHRNSYVLYVDLNHFRKPFERFCRNSKNVGHQQEELWALVHDALLPYAQQIGPIPFRISAKKLLQHYRQNILLPLAIAKNIPQDIYAQLFNILPNNGPFQVRTEKIRYYPFGRSACHVIGYVARSPQLSSDNLPGDSLRTFFLPQEKGRTGIEAFYNEQLSGFNGGDIWRVTPSGQEQNKLISISSTNGQDIHTSLDINLQRVCEEALGNYKGSISVLDVNSGEVLAMVSKPDFDLNQLTPYISKQTFDEITMSGAWLNRAIQGLYPPGSTFKIISLSAMLRTGIINENSRYNCTGFYRVGNRDFKCHKHSGHGLITTIEAIQKSCNPFIFKYGLQLGHTNLYQEACRYYMHVPTGIDLPYETHKICIPSAQWKKKRFQENWTDGDTANMLIGQGYLLMTPLKMACFAAALSNNRTVFVPHLVTTSPWKFSQALEQRDWEVIIRGMAGAGSHYIKRIPTAIKTGTAQIKVAQENGKYTHIGWLVGFAPIKNPQIAFCIEIEQAGIGNDFWGGQICAPIAQHFLDFYFKGKRNF